jgi:hypothetical protein
VRSGELALLLLFRSLRLWLLDQQLHHDNGWMRCASEAAWGERQASSSYRAIQKLQQHEELRIVSLFVVTG